MTMAQTINTENTAGKPVNKFDKLSADTPVLPSLSSLMEVELSVNEASSVRVILTKKLPYSYWWAEYDVDLAQLYFVTVDAQIQGLGMKIHKPFVENLTNAKEVSLLLANKKTEKLVGMPYVIPLVVRKNTLQDI